MTRRNPRRAYRRYDEKSFWANAYLSHVMGGLASNPVSAADDALEAYRERFASPPDVEEEGGVDGNLSPAEMKERIVDLFQLLGLCQESAQSFTDYALQFSEGK